MRRRWSGAERSDKLEIGKAKDARPRCARSGVASVDRKAVRRRSEKQKDPVVGSTGSSKAVQQRNNRSGRLRCSCFGYALCLRAFLSLNNFEFNVIALLETFVSLRLDGTVVDEHIRAVIPADKAEALCVIEPFHFTFNSRHVPYSGLSQGTRCTVVPRTSFFSWVCHSFWEGT